MVPIIAVLAAANLLNNRVAPRLAPLTSAAATGALVALARRAGLSWRELGFTAGRRGALAGAALAAGVAAGYAAALAHPRLRPLLLDERALGISRARLAEEVLLQVPVGTVLLEEVGFRGVVYGLAERAHGPLAATAVSSGLFGLWHVLPALDAYRANPAAAALLAKPPKRDENSAVAAENAMKMGRVNFTLGTVAGTTGAGVIFCELRRRYGLLAPALVHWATNAFGYMTSRVARRLSRS